MCLLFDESHFACGEVGKGSGRTGIHKTPQTTNQMKAVHIHLKILPKPVKLISLIASIKYLYTYVCKCKHIILMVRDN